MAEKITLFGVVTIAEGKKERAEETWRAIADNVATTEAGRVTFDLYYQADSGQYVVVQEFASEHVRDEYMSKAFIAACSKRMKEEGVLAREPEMGTEVRFVKRVIGGSGNARGS